MTLGLNLTRKLCRVCYRYVYTDTSNNVHINKTKWSVLKYGSIAATSGTAVYYYSLNEQQQRLYKVTLGGITRFIRYVTCLFK